MEIERPMVFTPKILIIDDEPEMCENLRILFDKKGYEDTSAGSGEDARETKYNFNWTLGAVVTAVAQAGLRIESLVEYPSTAKWRFGEKLREASKLPGGYLLLARKTSWQTGA